MADPPGAAFVILDNLVGIVTSPTYSFANDKFIYSHEIFVIKIQESLNFAVLIKL